MDNLESDRRQNFIRLAESRTIKAIAAIRVIGNLANKSSYEYEEADVKKIVSALNAEVEGIRRRLLESGTKREINFKL